MLSFQAHINKPKLLFYSIVRQDISAGATCGSGIIFGDLASLKSCLTMVGG